MTDTRAYVVTPQIFDKVLAKFFDSLKQQGIVEDYKINKQDRVVMVYFNPEANIPETKEDLISKGLFRNIDKILEDLEIEEAKGKLVTLPMYSTQEENDTVIINY